MKTDVEMVYPKVHKQGKEDIKVKVNTQSFIHPYIFFTLEWRIQQLLNYMPKC